MFECYVPAPQKKRPGFPGRLLSKVERFDLGAGLLRRRRDLRDRFLQLRGTLGALALRAELLALVAGGLGLAQLLSRRRGRSLVVLRLQRGTILRALDLFLRESGRGDGERSARDDNVTNLHGQYLLELFMAGSGRSIRHYPRRN